MPRPLNTLVRLLLCLAVAGCSPRDASPPAAPAARATTTATAPTPSPGGSCPGSGGDAQVTLNQIAVSGSTATIQVTPGNKAIGMNATGVRWKLNQNGYAFTSDGIVFKPNQPAGPASAPSTNSPTEFLWCFNATTQTGLVWNYSLKFTATAAPSTVWVCDPTIINSSGAVVTDAPPQTVNCTIQ